MNPIFKYKKTIILALAALSVGVVLVAPLIGITKIPWDVVFNGPGSSVESDIFWQIRIPRVALAFLAGSALSLSGMAFQAMFRNPLATPFTLGVSSGASLGAALYVRMGLSFSILGIQGISLTAFTGAVLTILLVYGITRSRRGFSTATMLLAGVAVSLIFSSVILFVQYMSDFNDSFHILRWLMGGMEMGRYSSVLNVLPFVIGGSLIVLYLSHDLNLITTGEDLAASRGVDVKSSRRLLFLATSLMIGGVVAICGPIGFVGLMVPHICRLVIGSEHRYLAPATLLFGGIFLTLCDVISRVLIAPAEIPVGIITALLGGPFFLWLLLDRVREGESFS